MTGQKFIDNLEKVNKTRVDQSKKALKEESSDEDAIIDLNPKKMEKPRDNIFMDLMAMYSKSSIKDKKTKASNKKQL